jgi:N-acetylglutamate synthase-like GNAT family acetyltransferase
MEINRSGLSEIKIRFADEKDIDRLVELTELWVSVDRKEKRIMLEKCMKLPNFHVLLAENNTGLLVGFIAVYIIHRWVNLNVVLDMDTIFVHPKYRNRGILRKLCEEFS